jgi:hypothetical protein
MYIVPKNNYSARKIYLTCDEVVVREWAAYLTGHADEVSQSLAQERVRHELWFMGRDADGLFLIGVMDVDDREASSKAAQASILSVDAVHRAFKQHWDRARSHDLPIDPSRAPGFPGCETLIDARPRSRSS